MFVSALLTVNSVPTEPQPPNPSGIADLYCRSMTVNVCIGSVLSPVIRTLNTVTECSYVPPVRCNGGF